MSNRRLDYLCGKHVMGYTVQDVGVANHPVYRLVDANGKRVSDNWQFHSSGVESDAWEVCPRFSSDIAAAWPIVEKMQENFSFSIAGTPPHSSILNGIQVVFVKSVHPPSDWQPIDGGAIERTAPLAICIAALRVVGVTEEEIQEAMDAR